MHKLLLFGLRNVQKTPVTLIVHNHCRFTNMPSNKKAGGGAGAGSKKSAGVTPPSSVETSDKNQQSSSVFKLTKEGDFSIAIQVKPGAKTNAVTDVSEEAVSVQIAAPPVDGEANTAIVKYFAELLNVKKADVSLKGGKSRQKTVTISSTCGLSISSIEDLLKQQVNK